MKALTAALTIAVLAATATPAIAAENVKIGSSGQYVSGIEKHKYGKLNGSPITDALFVNIETTVNWSQVANGSQDANLRRWANALDGKGLRFVSWSHEPMAKQNIHWGTASSFIASFKHVVSVFNQAGATNVEWVWNVTSNSFRVASSRSDYGAKWYPGDSYVDVVAGESYNRYGCGSDVVRSFAEQIKDIFAFAKQHHKKMMVAEFASNRYAGRDDWLRAARSYLNANQANFRGAFYYNSAGFDRCEWRLSSSEQTILRSFETI